MNENIEHIIDKEYEENSHSLEYVEGLKNYISKGRDNRRRRMAASILNKISRFYLLDDTFDFLLNQIKNEKSKHEKTEFIRELQGLKSNSMSIEYLIDITKKRETIPKRNAYRAMTTIKHESIEAHVLERIQLEKNNGVIEAAVQSLTINGTSKSIKPLIGIFKKSRDGSIRAHIVNVLEQIINREDISEIEQKEINKFSKKSKLGFENIWKGAPKIIDKSQILIEAEKQLSKNKLNLEFGIDSNFKAALNIEKMKQEYLRHISYSISSSLPSTFFKELKIHSYGTGNSINYTQYLDQSDNMRPADYKEQIMNSISNEFIPYLFDVHLGLKKYLLWNYLEFTENYVQLKTNLKVNDPLMTFLSLSRYKKGQEDYDKYIKHCLELWDKEFRGYRIREYLLNELNTVGNKL